MLNIQHISYAGRMTLSNKTLNELTTLLNDLGVTFDGYSSSDVAIRIMKYVLASQIAKSQKSINESVNGKVK